MTNADIVWEYRQMKALEYEEKTGKQYEETTYDTSYAEYQRSLGIDVGDDDA